MDAPQQSPVATAENPPSAEGRDPGFAQRVKTGVIWRSGSQLLGQLIAWTSTFLVIRMLEPADYGLVAMTGVILTFLTLFNGWGFASSLVRDERTDKVKIGQAFAMLILMNAVLAALQVAGAPLAAAYFHQPMVADLLRVQALFFLANPFIALGHALLVRRLEFKRQSRIDLIAAAISALTAVSCALTGLGIWTLVAAPGALWVSRAIGYIVAARIWEIRPRFRFDGAGTMLRYGTAMVAVQACWFAQSQADIFIAGRLLEPHALGIYTTALFLTQILAAKFVPPLNEVAFAAYSRIQDQRDVIRTAFLKSVRLIMLVVLPFYFGLAATAGPFVACRARREMGGDGAARPHPRHGDAADDAADPVRAGDQRARAARPRGAHRPGRRAVHAPRLPRRHPVGRDGPCLGLARRHRQCCSPRRSSSRGPCWRSAAAPCSAPSRPASPLRG